MKVLQYLDAILEQYIPVSKHSQNTVKTLSKHCHNTVTILSQHCHSAGDEGKQAEKLKSREMKEGWMKNDEGWMMKDDDFKLLRGFDYRQKGRLTDGHLWL